MEPDYPAFHHSFMISVGFTGAVKKILLFLVPPPKSNIRPKPEALSCTLKRAWGQGCKKPGFRGQLTDMPGLSAGGPMAGRGIME